MFAANSWDNYEKAQYLGVGKYDIPEMQATDYVPSNLIKFNYRGNAANKESTAIHFFMYDGLFRSVWNFPDRFIDKFSEYGAVIAPDFSVYNDFPKALQIMAHYKRQWIGRYWQDKGLTVIPDVAWCGKMSYDYFCAGIPSNGTVCVSSVGMTRTRENKKIFIDGWFEMLKQITPKTVLLYGEVPDEIKGSSNIKAFRACCEQYKIKETKQNANISRRNNEVRREQDA